MSGADSDDLPPLQYTAGAGADGMSPISFSEAGAATGADSDDLPPLPADASSSPPVPQPAPSSSGGSSVSSASLQQSMSPPVSSPSPLGASATYYPPSVNVSPSPTAPLARAPQASPTTHASRPHPVVVHSELIKSRTPAGQKTINGRLLMHALGEGATAEVTLCLDSESSEHFALKKMSKRALSKQKEYSSGPMGRPKITTGLDKVRREIALMGQVWHPNVLVLDSVIDDPREDALILVLEYASQGQIMHFDSKQLRYRNHIFGKADNSGAAAANAAASSAAATAAAASAATTVPASASATAPSAASSASASSAASSAPSQQSPQSSSSSLLHDPPIPESILRKIVLDALAGLEYLHSLRIAHRDIKPDNLLLSSDGTVKLADLGVARQFGPDESEFISETHGTYHFFSPEMCSGERYSAFISDLWSFGVTLFILATGGTVPFLSAMDNPQELFTQIGDYKRGQAPYPPDCPASPALRDLVDGILEPDPSKRLTIAQIREHHWMRQTQDQTGEPPSPLKHDMRDLALTSPILVPATE